MGMSHMHEYCLATALAESSPLLSLLLSFFIFKYLHRNSPMVQRKIQLEDLANLNDGTKIDITEVTEAVNPGYNLIIEEVETFVDRPVVKAKAIKNSFNNYLPPSDLKESIAELLKTKNIKEERIKKHMQFEFDRKMQRINRIKSRAFRRLQRREKIRKEEAMNAEEESGSDAGSESGSNDSSTKESEASCSESSVSEENKTKKAIPAEELPNPVFEFNKAEISAPVVPDLQYEMVKNAFSNPALSGNTTDFIKEKHEIVDADAPKTIETVLPGWDDWAGEGLEVKKTKYNTVVETKDGIFVTDRKDYAHGNVIINEHVTIPDKYKSTLPYGYNTKEYKEWLKTPISAETNSLRIFKKFVKMNKKEDTTPGVNIKPNEFVPEY